MKITEQYIYDLKDNLKNISGINALRNKSVLITGATGLIGSVVVDLLLAANKFLHFNMKIWVAARDVKKILERFDYWDGKYNFIFYDASKEIEFENYVDYIIHCASFSHPVLYANNPVESLLINVIGTNNLLKYSVDKKIKRFLYVSSSEVYGNKEGCVPYIEDEYSYVDILNPRACYPSGKRAAETLCASYAKEYDVDTVIVRPGHVYGPAITENDSRAHAQFARDVMKGKDIIMKSSGMQLRSYCYVLDCATAILTVLLRGARAEAYNISNKDSIVTIREFAEMHAKLTGHKVIFETPEKKDSAGYNLMSCSALNSDKLYDLGWKGLYNLERGVYKTIKLL